MRDTSSTLSVRLPQAPAQARGNRSDLACVLSQLDRKSTRLNSSHVRISYAVFCLKKKKILLESTRASRVFDYFTLKDNASTTHNAFATQNVAKRPLHNTHTSINITHLYTYSHASN